MSDITKTVEMEKEGANVLTPRSVSLDAAIDNAIFIDPVLEKRTLAKYDKFVLPQMALLIIIAYLDRSNIGTPFIFLRRYSPTNYLYVIDHTNKLDRKCKSLLI